MNRIPPAKAGVILIIDDTPANLEVLCDFLADAGFQVLIAEDGESAIQTAEYAAPDLVLLDVLMPGMDGFETCRQLKANPATHEIPVIFMTALSEPVDKVKGLSLGAVDYITKPLQHQEARARVRLHLNLRQLTQQLQGQNVRLEQEIQERKKAEETLRQQLVQQRLVAEIAQNVRQSLNLQEILNSAVSEVRQFLRSDRAFIYRFEPDWGGVVVVESVGSDWRPILGSKLKDPTFAEAYVQHYKEGRIQATADIYAGNLTECYINFLAEFQVKATLVVPILQGDNLWGLLVANHCAQPRQWQQLEIDCLKQLATQVAIAIQQSELYQQAQTELIERQRAEEKIRQQAALLDVATDAIFVQDLQNQILFWSKGAKRLYGWQVEEALAKPVDELLYEAAPPKVAQQIAVETGEWQGELHQVTKAGNHIIVASRWSLMRDDKGQPQSILTVSTDITEKKQLEAQLLRAQRLESLGTLAGGISHDLNNILTPILAAAQLLPLKLSQVDEQSQHMLEIMEASAKRGVALVKQVLSFARGVEGKRTIVQVRHLIGEVKQFVKQTFPKTIEVYSNLAPDLWPVLGDATHLHQVLMNLTVNARDAMPEGGTLSFHAENLIIDAQYAQMHLDAQVGPYIVITVADTGGGMPPEVVDRIFEPFFTTKELGKGTGLGLSMVLGIVKSHGGFVKVVSQVGAGTEFKIFFPAAQGSEMLAGESSTLPSGQGEVVLLVDDEAPIREITKTSLEACNYKVLTASDGIEAIALYAQHQAEIEVVLLDMIMPSMDGPTTIRTLRKMNPQIKIVATSGLVTSNQLMELVGSVAFLAKPYTTHELLSTLQGVLHLEA